MRAADFGHSNSVDLTSSTERDRRLCKSFIEEDRRLYATQFGYSAHLVQMPAYSSPKNDIIIGYSKELCIPGIFNNDS